jgi:hypothetical protein
MAVFQVDASVLDSNHGADVAGLDILDDRAELSGMFGRARLAPTGGQNVGSVAIHHAAILGTLAAKIRYGAPMGRRPGRR